MSRDTILARGRVAAAVGFIDTCTVKRRIGQQTDLLDGTVIDQLQPLYSGPCRVQQAAAPWAGPAVVGQAQIGLSALEIQLPVVGSENITKDDIVTVTTCVYDADLAGKSFTVQGAHHATHKTTRRLPLQEILG